MNKKIFLLLPIIFCSSIYPQEWSRSKLDSLFNLYVKLHTHNFNIQQPEEQTTAVKCGFGIAADIFIHFKEFTVSQQKILKPLFERPVTETSIVSDSGWFRIHYNINNPPTPAYDVHEFARALDSAYNFEVNYLGFPPPPHDTYGGIPGDSVGGDDKYDVYIVALTGLYGETVFENEFAPNKYTSFMRVHYDFDTGFYTHGIDAARVTAAHEFHHSIQIGDYIFKVEDQFFYELTSTSMEEFVFNTVNDYYGYMGSYFSHPDGAFASYDGYDLAIWNIFLKIKYGFGIIKRQWELMPYKRAIDAINTSLFERQSSFGKELNTFGIWTYFTNSRAKSGYFPEGANYPLLHLQNFEINNPLNFNSIKPTSNNSLKSIVQSLQDTLAVILTNSDYLSGINNISKDYTATYNLFNYNSPGSTRLDSNYYEQLTVENTSIWLTSVILNGNLIKQDTTLYPPVAGNIDYAYPNPFRYDHFQNHNIINIPVNSPVNTEVEVYIYSVSMDLISNTNLNVTYDLKYNTIVKWDLDNIGKKLASGVYIYVTKTNKGEKVGKLVILNE